MGKFCSLIWFLKRLINKFIFFVLITFIHLSLFLFQTTRKSDYYNWMITDCCSCCLNTFKWTSKETPGSLFLVPFYELYLPNEVSYPSFMWHMIEDHNYELLFVSLKNIIIPSRFGNSNSSNSFNRTSLSWFFQVTARYHLRWIYLRFILQAQILY